mgnify:CR=1
MEVKNVTELSAEEADALIDALFLRAVVAGQAFERISTDPTRDELLAFVAGVAARIATEYEAFKASKTTEATIVEEVPHAE